MEIWEEESGGIASRKSPFQELSSLGKAKAASLLSAIEAWTEAWAEAHEEGSEREAALIAHRLEDFARRLSDLLGIRGTWEWLGEEFPENPLNWAAGSFAAGQPRHPALWAARTGAARLEFFLERGAPLRVFFAKGRVAIDMGSVAGKSKSEGAFGVLERRFRREGPLESRRQIMAWLSGCAAGLWAEGIREAEGAFREAFPTGSPDPYWGDVFASPLEELLWSPEAARNPQAAQETLDALLSLAVEERWPMEADSPPDESEGGEPQDHFESALMAGAWWALDDLRCPGVALEESRLVSLKDSAERLDAEHEAAVEKAFKIALSISQRDALEKKAGESGDRSGKGRRGI